MALGLQGADHLFLLGGGEAGEDVSLERGAVEGFLVHRGQLGAGDDAAHGHADVLADLPGDEFIVTREDLGADAALAQAGEGGGGGLLGRVEEGEVAEEDEVGLVGGGEDLAGAVEVAVGEGDDAETLGGKGAVFLKDLVLDHRDHRVQLVVDLVAVADRQDLLDRAFADQLVVALMVDDDRHAAPLEVEGDLVDLAARAFDVEVGA